MIKMNRNFSKIPENYLFAEISKKTREFSEKNPDMKIVNLGIGDCTEPLPEPVVTEMKTAADEFLKNETFHGYGPYGGYMFLREKIAEYYKRRNVFLSPDEIFITDGAKGEFFFLSSLFGKSKAVVCDPVYPVYSEVSVFSGKKTVYIPATEDLGFVPDRSFLKGRNYIIYLCSPNNPTGVVYSESDLEKWVEFSLRTDSLIVFDSAYKEYITENFPRSIFEIYGAEKCAVEISSFSKGFGFTGLRLGYTVIPEKLKIKNIKVKDCYARLKSAVFNGVSYITQRGGLSALSENGLFSAKNTVKYYLENALLLSSALIKKRAVFYGGSSSPYLWVKCENKTSSKEAFEKYLENGIVVTPGVGFGKNGEGFFRISSFGKREDILYASEKIPYI